MKRRALISHLKKHRCSLLREGPRHSIWHCAKTGLATSVPRHRELGDLLCGEICAQLGIESIRQRGKRSGCG